MSGRLVITDRGIRLVQTLVASTVALALLLVTSGVSGPAAPENGWTSLRGFAALDAAPCPSTTSVALPTVSPARIEAARKRRFSVFGPRPTELDEPIDWHTDPLGAERYRQNLHKLRFLTPLLSSYGYDDQAADLEQAVPPALAVTYPRNRGGNRTTWIEPLRNRTRSRPRASSTFGPSTVTTLTYSGFRWPRGVTASRRISSTPTLR